MEWVFPTKTFVRIDYIYIILKRDTIVIIIILYTSYINDIPFAILPMLFVLYYSIISPARWVFMVGGPNGTTSGEEMILSLLLPAVCTSHYKVVRVSGK